MSTPTLTDLKSALKIREQISRLESQLAQFLGNGSNGVTPVKRVKRPMSAATKAKIRAAQKRRWKELKKAAK